MTTNPPPDSREALLEALYDTPRPVPLSFEMFPPRSAIAKADLWDTVTRLAPAASAGFSVTMGAGGTSRDGTVGTAAGIAQHSRRPVMAHLISAGMTAQETLQTAERLHDESITRILALRGDAPQGSSGPAFGFANAAALVSELSRLGGFDISVAAYPEKHPEAADLDTDIDHLKAKLDVGASRAICQFVLNPESYGRFLDRCAARGVTAPIVPGVMPLDNWPRVRRFAMSTGALVPGWLDRLLDYREGEAALTPMLGLAATLAQTRRLIDYGAPGLHIYALNNWQMPLALARMLGADEGQFQKT